MEVLYKKLQDSKLRMLIFTLMNLLLEVLTSLQAIMD